MSYTVLARRYRSLTFDDIVGQEPIANTLRSAIQSNRTAHAYLFCGTRGVGKTSMARIFARELNESKDLQQRELIGEAILRGEDLDVIEIDGASNRGVQEARDLIAAAGLSPTRCKYRIYIIDEVHMLTTPAFNALLKTMEEPPSHVKFILCTTEPHKVPSTIQSRCQRFDFKSISSSKIAEHLTYVLQEEGIEADSEVIAEVSRLGNGSMRDALSILDRLLSGGMSSIKAEDMEELLGLPSHTAIMQLCDAIASSNMQLAFTSSDALLSSGISMDRVLEIVAMTCRDALICKVCGPETPLLEVTHETMKHLESVAKLLTEATLTHFIALCDASSRQVRRGGSGRALFDATIARMCMAGELSEAGSILSVTPPATLQNKKKSITSQSDISNKISLPTSEEANQVSVTWDKLQSVISETPGLKIIAQYLKLFSIDGRQVTCTISDSGRDSVNYILGQRQRIERVLSKEFGGSFTFIIDATQFNQIESAVDVAIDSVEQDELVQVARGLFNGTVVQVWGATKDDK